MGISRKSTGRAANATRRQTFVPEPFRSNQVIATNANIRRKRQQRPVEKISRTSSEPTLSDEDHQRAFYRAPLIKEDVETLSLPRLLAKVQHAIQKGDSVELYLLLRYGDALLRENRQTDRHTEQRGALAGMLKHIGDRSSDRRNLQTNTRAKALIEEAKEIRDRADKRRLEALKRANPASVDKRYGAL